MRVEEFTIEGRNAVLEAYRAGKTIDKLFVRRIRRNTESAILRRKSMIVAVILMRAAMAEASAKIAVMRTAILKIWKIRGYIIASV